MIPIANILYVNATLQFAPVLVQGFGVHYPAETQLLPFPFKSTAMFSKNSSKSELDRLTKHPAVPVLAELLDLNHSCGYLTFANVGVLDFGRPTGESIQVRLKGKTFQCPTIRFVSLFIFRRLA